jgi:dienelactone hydrolase
MNVVRIALVIAALCWSVVAIAQSAEPATEFIATRLVEDGKPVRLKLLVYKPAGSGPFPTVVFNHGSTGSGSNPADFVEAWSSPTAAEWFVKRGWLVLFPQRRGRGGSDGRYDEGFEPDRSGYSCDPVHSLPGVDHAMADLDEVMAHVQARPDVANGRLLLAGQSRGGILSIAYAGVHPGDFVGVVNFVGGWMAGCPGAVQINTTTFKRGAAFPRPTLWLYGESDPYYSIPFSRANFDAFVAAGGKGKFVSYVVPGEDQGHRVQRHPALWSDELDRYLDTVALPR